MIVVDTGPLYAAADATDAHHATCTSLFISPPDRLVIPVSVVVETSFLIERHLGSTAEAAFLGSLTRGGISIEQLGPDDLTRMAELDAIGLPSQEFIGRVAIGRPTSGCRLSGN